MKQLLITFLMVMGIVQLAFAETAEKDKSWTDTSIHENSEIEARKNAITEGGEIIIRDKYDLAAYAQKLKEESKAGNSVSFKSINTATLVFECGNINMSDHIWEPLGKYGSIPWQGSIRGIDGCTIINGLRMGYSSSFRNCAFIGHVSSTDVSKVSISNIRFSDCSVENKDNVSAILIGLVDGGTKLEISNVAFASCTIDAMDFSSFAIASIAEGNMKSNVTLSNVTVIKGKITTKGTGSSTDNHDGNDCAGLISIAKNSNITISGVDIDDPDIYGGNSDVGGLIGYVEKSDITINRVKMYSPYIYAYGKNSGGLIGHIKESSRLSISDLDITEVYVRSEKANTGGLVGYIEETPTKIADVKSKKIDVYNLAGGAVGGFVGLFDTSDGNATDSVNTITNCVCDSNFVAISGKKGGGFVGELKGKLDINNCIQNHARFSGTDAEYFGGFVGTISSSTTYLNVNNSFIDFSVGYFYDKEYQGGIVGFLGPNSGATVQNTIIYTDPSKVFHSEETKGLIFGGSDNSTTHINFCYLTNFLRSTISINDNTEEYADLVVGKQFKSENSGTHSRTGLYAWADITESTPAGHAMAAYYTAMMNEHSSDARFTYRYDEQPHQQPVCRSDSGMIVRYIPSHGSKITDFKSNGIGYDYLNHNGSCMAYNGMETIWKYDRGTGWIVDDRTEQMNDVSRIDADHFKGIPAGEPTTKTPIIYGTLSEHTPQYTFSDTEYNSTLQKVTLRWALTEETVKDFDSYWQEGKWYVLRNGAVLDTLKASATTEYIDNDPPLEKNVRYTVKFADQDMFYQDSISTAINCDNIPNIPLTADSIAGGVKLTALVPNAYSYDGCTMNLYKWDNNVLHPTLDELMSKKPLKSETFKYQPQTDQDKINVTFYDTESTLECSRYYYMVVCTDFKSEAFKGKTIVSDETSYAPGNLVDITLFSATKGESADKVTLNWKSLLANNGLDVRYIVERKVYNIADASLSVDADTLDWVKINDVINSNTTNSYTDYALPGYVYKYRLKAYVACEGTYNVASYAKCKTAVGYAASRGTIMGSIAYSGSTSVKGVDVRITPDSESLTTQKGLAYSRDFTGDKDCLPLATDMGKDYWQGDWSVQFLLRPFGTNDNVQLLAIPGIAAVHMKGGKLCMGEKTMDIKKDIYSRLLLSHSDGKLRLGIQNTPEDTYGDYCPWGIELDEASNKAWLESAQLSEFRDTLYFGRSNDSCDVKSFCGFLDEVRVWHKALNNEEIRSTYNRYLTGEETDLSAYYTFDDGVLEQALDNSHPKGTWNNRNTDLIVFDNGTYYPKVSTTCPSDSVLCYRGITDDKGQYQIAGIPYFGEGTSYMVVPVYGTHEFSPAEIRRYVSSESLTHHDINFTDISSFPVPVKVCYAYGNFPVKGATVLVDGIPASHGYIPSTTDADGTCTVDVPIGAHKLTVRLANHEFVNDGYPCSIDSVMPNGYYNFTALQDRDSLINFQSVPSAAFTFFDKTMVRFAGRVAGGNNETDKPIGGRLSYANLGKAKVTLAPQEKTGYVINKSETMAITIPGDLQQGDSIYSKTVFPPYSNNVEITTDSITGEFLAWLPPIDYCVTDVTTLGNAATTLTKEDFGLNNSSTNINFSMTKMLADSIPVSGSESRAFLYNAKKKFTYYTDPTFDLTNGNSTSNPKMLGDSIYATTYLDDYNMIVNDTIPLWDKRVRDGSPASYTIDGMPTFLQGVKYKLNIRLYEEYVNRDYGTAKTYDLMGVPVTIENTFSNDKVTVDMTTDSIKYAVVTDSLTQTMTQNSDGVLEYEFTAGFPNSTAPYTHTMSFTYDTNGKVYHYPADNGAITGRIIGNLMVPGTDFVTAGPNLVSFVLRDPPGSGSSAYLEKGSTVSTNFTWHEGFNGSLSGGCNLKIGLGITILNREGNVNVQVAEFDYDHNVDVNLSSASSFVWGTTYNLSFTTNERLSTSSSSTYVGSDGDVYVGTSTNLTFSKCQTIGPVYSGSGDIKGGSGKYTFGEKENNSIAPSYTTTFQYSQKHIINELMPELRKLRRQSCIETDLDFSAIYDSSPSDKPIYYVHPDVDDNKTEWVKDIDYKFVAPAGKNSADSVNVYSQWIKGWEDAIAHNEMIKAKTPRVYGTDTYIYKDGSDPNNMYSAKTEYGYMGNVSFDAGSSKSVSVTRSKDNTHSFKIDNKEGGIVKWNCNFAWDILGAERGATSDVTIGLNYVSDYTTSKTTNTKQTFGYTLADSNGGNYYSVDTYLPGSSDLTGEKYELDFSEFYVFRLKGGQSKCPYQAAEYTKYYKEASGKDSVFVKIGDGTIAIEDPKITFETTSYTDCPNGQPLAIPLTLTNQSTATVTTAPMFNFLVEADSNPDGLEFTIDGVPVGNGNSFDVFLLPGQSVKKTLLVKQTQKDILNYKNIVMSLYSECQVTRFVSDTLNIFFKPVSSPVVMEQSSKVVNSTSGNTADFTISSYNIGYDKFAGINIQYRSPIDVDWRTATTLVNDSALIAETWGKENFPEPYQMLDKGGKTRVTVDMSNFADGEYLFRAEAFSFNGLETITNDSEELTIIKDTEAPAVLNKPQAYYDGQQDIEIRFTEPLDQQLLTDDNFYVTGVLNDAEVTHNVGLHFDGNTPAKTNSRVDLFGQNSTIAFWYKPVVDKQSCLFSQVIGKDGNDEKHIALYYTKDATLKLQLGDKVYESTHKAVLEDGVKVEDWMYAALSYDKDANSIEVYNLFGTSDGDESHFISVPSAGLTSGTNVPLYIGGNAWDKTAEGECHADIEGFAVYDSNRSIAEISADKANKHEDNTRCLLAYWPMDEGQGMEARDIVRQRNLVLSGTDNWYLPVTNYALKLDGKQQYMMINTSTCPITKSDDYVLEFWFRDMSDGSKEQTIFSNGWGGIGTPEAEPANRLSIGLSTEGRIVVSSLGKRYEMGRGYNDHNWHHLALDVQRDGYATVLVDTVDVSGAVSVKGSSLGSFDNSKMTIGALRYTIVSDSANYSTDSVVVDNYFCGEVDEVRLWKAHKTVKAVKARAYDRLTGSEPGLVAYYPFEYSRLVAQQETTYKCVDDRVTADAESGINPADKPEMTGYGAEADSLLIDCCVGSEAPVLRPADFANIVTMQWKSNGDDGIVLSFPETLPKSRIENCTLNFTVKNVKDVCGNRMTSPYTWNVYVHQNPLTWYVANSNIKQSAGETQQTEIVIVNKSRSAQVWSIDNIPQWAELSRTTGMINPLEMTTVSLTTRSEAAIGQYQNVMYLTDSQDLSAPLHVNLTVTNVKPDWKPVATDGSVWMSMLSRLKVNGNWSVSEDDMVGVFTKEGRCLGVASPEYNADMDTYFTLIDIKGESKDDNQPLVVSVWESSTGLIYSDAVISCYRSNRLDTITDFRLQNFTVLGNFSKPYIVSTRNSVRQTIPLKQGWNWLSFWVKPAVGLNAADVFAGILPSIADVKQRTTGYTTSNISELTLTPSESYMIYAKEAANLVLEGDAYAPENVDIVFTDPTKVGDEKWYWIGYPLTNTKTLGEAFADFRPADNDIVKSLDAFAMYNGKSWTGSLKYLAPGQGYLYNYHGNAANDSIWHYPSAAKATKKQASRSGYSVEVDPYDYENYTFMTAHVLYAGQPYGSNYHLAAFDEDGICRGVAKAEAGKPAYISIYGNYGDTFTFRLYDESRNGYYDLVGEKLFDSTTPEQVMTFNVNTATAITDIQCSDADQLPTFNIGGARQSNGNLPKGVYIRDGKKVVK